MNDLRDMLIEAGRKAKRKCWNDAKTGPTRNLVGMPMHFNADADAAVDGALEALDTAGYTIVPKPSGDERARVARAVRSIPELFLHDLGVDEWHVCRLEDGHTLENPRWIVLGEACNEDEALERRREIGALMIADAALAAITPKPATDWMREALERAYTNGFCQSVEGWNGEHPKRAELSDGFKMLRDEYVAGLASDGLRAYGHRDQPAAQPPEEE